MNEKIKSLLKSNNVYTDSSGRWISSKDIDKFALAIVQECINKIERYRIPVGNSSAGEMACEWTYDALKEIRDEIWETFGVGQGKDPAS